LGSWNAPHLHPALQFRVSLNLQALSWKLPKRDRLLVLTEHHRISDDSLQRTETWGISLLPGAVTVRCLLRLHGIQMAANLIKCATKYIGKNQVPHLCDCQNEHVMGQVWRACEHDQPAAALCKVTGKAERKVNFTCFVSPLVVMAPLTEESSSFLIT
jgi:hypothetical protein